MRHLFSPLAGSHVACSNLYRRGTLLFITGAKKVSALRHYNASRFATRASVRNPPFVRLVVVVLMIFKMSTLLQDDRSRCAVCKIRTCHRWNSYRRSAVSFAKCTKSILASLARDKSQKVVSTALRNTKVKNLDTLFSFCSGNLLNKLHCLSVLKKFESRDLCTR